MKSIPYQMIKFEQEVRDAIEKRSAADFAEYKKDWSAKIKEFT